MLVTPQKPAVCTFQCVTPPLSEVTTLLNFVTTIAFIYFLLLHLHMHAKKVEHHFINISKIIL